MKVFRAQPHPWDPTMACVYDADAEAQDVLEWFVQWLAEAKPGDTFKLEVEEMSRREYNSIPDPG